MSFIKKVLVLKEIEEGFSLSGKRISGICRVETEDGVSRLFLTVINAAAKSDFEYKIMIIDAKKTSFTFNLGSRPSSFTATLPAASVERGLCAGIYAVKDDIPITVAFAKEDGFNITVSDFKRTVAEKCLLEKREREKQAEKKPQVEEPLPTPTEKDDPAPVRPPYPPAPQPDPTVTPPEEFPSPKSEEIRAEYDDEAVATENYYAFDREIEQKLNAVKEWTYENVRMEDGKPYFGGEEEKTQSVKNAYCAQNEESFNRGEEYSEDRPFFVSVRSELDGIFKKFPPEESLQKTFYGSRWARINYSSDKYYVVGLVKEDNKEKYVCYGVPGVYSENPPEELKGYCTFIPLSIFDLSGDGYWIMFQDAVTGQCKKPETVY